MKTRRRRSLLVSVAAAMELRQRAEYPWPPMRSCIRGARQMKSFEFKHYALCASTSIVMLAGCGGGSGTPLSPSPAGPSTALTAPAAERTHSKVRYKVLHSFGGSADASNPYAGLLNVEGTLYGTTAYGGANGDGTVFSITPSGTETVLYSFKGGPGDGEYPFASLINVNGTLYGTTSQGGAYCSSTGGCGTVFSITPSGTETVLHSFGGSGDGNGPLAGLINVKGKLYGTTMEGGANGDGTVFSIAPSGKESVRYSFKGGSGDGEFPLAGLINVKGKLYGTTVYGGASDNGTVFSITPSGRETVLYSFKGSGDGATPICGPHQRRGHVLRHDASRRRKRRRSGLLDHAVRHGNRALQLQRRIRRRRIPICRPHRRQRHALRHDD